MTPLEILEAHKSYRTYINDEYKPKVSCCCGNQDIGLEGSLADDSHRRHVAQVLDEAMQEQKAEAWDRGHARALSGIIPTGNEPEPRNPYRTETGK